MTARLNDHEPEPLHFWRGAIAAVLVSVALWYGIAVWYLLVG